MTSGLTQRGALQALKLTRPSLKYQPKPDRNVHLKERLRQVARPGTGYRSAWRELQNEFAPLSQKRVYKAWKELNLSLKTKTRKKRTGMPMLGAPSAPNQVWSLDFVHDSCLNGTKFKVLVVIDEFTRECLALEARASMKAVEVRQILAKLFALKGGPTFCEAIMAQNSLLMSSEFGLLFLALRAVLLSQDHRGEMAKLRALILGYKQSF